MVAYEMTAEERDAVLAGLRLLQRGWETGRIRSDDEFGEIATCGGEHDALTPGEIDDLCERINA